MLKRINLTGNPNLGVYISVNDEVAIVPFNLPTEMEPIMKEALEVDIIRTSIAGCNLNGVLSTGNSNGFVLSPHATDREVETLEDAGLNVARLPGKYTAVGNILAVNDYGAIAGPNIKEETIKVIEDTLKVPVEIYTKVLFYTEILYPMNLIMLKSSLKWKPILEPYVKVCLL